MVMVISMFSPCNCLASLSLPSGLGAPVTHAVKMCLLGGCFGNRFVAVCEED